MVTALALKLRPEPVGRCAELALVAVEPTAWEARPQWRLRLSIAGFATAGGRSPQALQNLGAGALAGVQTLEAERAALPEQQLKIAQGQMANLQVQNARAMRAYFSGQNPDPSPVAGQLDRNIDAAKSGIQNSGETNAVSTPTGAMAPLPGMSQDMPLSADEQAISAQVQGQIANIDSVISQQAQLARFATTPEQMSQMQGNLANLAIRRSELLKEDPDYMRAASQATEEGKTGPLVTQAALTTAAKTANEFHTIRPGGYGGIGTNMTIAAPVQRPAIDTSTGNEYPRFVTPPLPGAGQAPSNVAAAPNGTPPGAAPGATPAGFAGEAPSKLGVGPEESLRKRAEDEQNARDETLKDAQGAQNQQATLNILKQNAADIYTGPGADYVGDFQKVARLIYPNYDDSVAARESLNKNGGQLIRQATRELSPRAAFQEVQFVQSTLPNQNMSPKGLGLVVGELQGLNDYKIAKAMAQNSWEMAHGGTGRVEGFESDWQAHAPVTPYTFIIQRMPQPDRQALFAKWNQTDEGRAELQKLRGQVQYAAQNGLNP